MLSREPVRVAWVALSAVQGITTILLATEVISQVAGAIIVGTTTVVYGAISELFVRAEVVPLRPLEALSAVQSTSKNQTGDRADGPVVSDQGAGAPGEASEVLWNPEEGDRRAP